MGNLDAVPGSADPQTLPHTCGGCDARWRGHRTAHCGSGCHRTFTGVTTFDMHRNGGRCLTPRAMGMSLAPGRAYPAWGYVGDREE
jgi:hypothetical protein